MAIVSVHIRTSFVVVFTCLCPVRAEVWDASQSSGCGHNGTAGWVWAQWWVCVSQQGGSVYHSRVGVWITAGQQCIYMYITGII